MIAVMRRRRRCSISRNKAARRSAVRPLVQQQRKLEAEIETHTRLVDDLERRLTLASAQRKVDEITALSVERKQTGAALQRLEAKWLATQEAIDSMGGEGALR